MSLLPVFSLVPIQIPVGLAAVVVLDGAPHGSVTLEGERHRQVDGDAEDDLVKLVEEVAEGVLVDLAELVAVLPEIRSLSQCLGLTHSTECESLCKSIHRFLRFPPN